MRTNHILTFAIFPLLFSMNARALDLDWSGQFRSEANWIKNYNSSNGTGSDSTRANAGGYYVPGGGREDADFQTLFMKLKPKVIVNDNVYIKSEWWVGDPIYGFFGDGQPYSPDRRRFDSTYSRGSTITAQRFWADFLSDLGTVQVGRAPINWGLGLIWSSGDGLWDRYQSTGDTLRLVSKFGAFSFIPAFTKYSMGNAVGGGCIWNSATGTCVGAGNGAGLSEYSLSFKYENPEEDFEGGLNFVRRLGAVGQDVTSGYSGANSSVGSGAQYTIWDLYTRKKLGKFSFAGEVPIITGQVDSIRDGYKTFAVALETKYKFNDTWSVFLNGGHAPGQGNIPPSQAMPGRYRAFYFNPNYKIAMMMFNYNFAAFAGPNTQNNPAITAQQLKSPYENPIVNANYINGGTHLQAGDKWTFKANYAYAKAIETASPSTSFYNTWNRRYVNNGTSKSQGNSLGFEMDYTAQFQYDEAFVFIYDIGWFWPGNYYAFSNAQATDNNTDGIMGMQFKVGVNF